MSTLSAIDHERSMLKLAQFKLLNNDKELDDYKSIELLLQELDLNIKVPETSFLRDHNKHIIGDSLLHLATQEGNVELYNDLIYKGADFNMKDNEGKTVLHEAFQNFCALHHSLRWKFNKARYATKFIEPTLSAHVNYTNTNNPSNSNGLTHFHIACATNNTEAVEFFLSNGIPVNQAVGCVRSSTKDFGGYTPLHFAAEFGCIEVVNVLLKYGATTNLEDHKGQTPLHIVLKQNIELIDSSKCEHLLKDVETNEQIIDLLLGRIISPKLSHVLVASAMKDSCKIKNLVEQGFDVNQCISMDSQIWPGYTALHFAAHVSVDTVKLLMKHGANVETKEANGVTPFDMCIDRYQISDIFDIMRLVPNWKNIVLSDGKTKLVDLLLTFKNLDSISKFLQKSKDNLELLVPFDSPLWPGCTVLHLAVLLNERKKCKTDYKNVKTRRLFQPDLTVIEECLKQDADVTVKDRRSWTAIHLAFRLEKHKILDLLLQHHHRVKDSVDDENLSHLHIACARENKDLVKKFVWNDVDVNVVYKGESPVSCVYPGWTPLHVAVQKHNDEIGKLLHQFGADVYLPDAYGFTAIHQSMCCVSLPKVSQTLLSVPNLRDFVVEGVGLSYLHLACATCSVDVVKRLLDRGADVNGAIVCTNTDAKMSCPTLWNVKTQDGSTPLHFALTNCASDRLELWSLLIERGADVLAKDSNDASPLSESLESKNTEFLDVIVDFFKRDVDLGKRVEAETGLTLLHIACRRVDVDLARELLKNGADVNARVHENWTIWPKYTALHVLVLHEDLDGDDDKVNSMIVLLLRYNADVTLLDNDGDSPLHVAYRRLCVEQDGSTLDNVILLLKAQKNFEVNPTTAEGFSHFHIACHMLEVEVVENFLKHGVDVNSKIDMFCDSQIAASTPLHLAVKSARKFKADLTNSFPKLIAQLEIVDLLIKHGADVDVEDVFGNTPVHYVGSCNFSKGCLLQRLAKSGANVNARNVRGEAPLELLLKKGNFTDEEVRHFITFGCAFNTFNAVTEKGYIALADSVIPHSEMQLLLFETLVNSPDLMKVDGMKRTALHNVVSNNAPETTQEQYVELVDIFMSFGCDVDDQDASGRTALHLAAQFRNESAVAGLLAVGADVNVTDRSGKTPFAYAFEPCSRCPTDIKDHDQYSHSELFETFMSHIKKMDFFEIFVNRSNRFILDKAHERFDSADILNDLDDILLEFTLMANIKIEPYSLTAADFVSTAAAVIDYPTMSLAKRTAIDAFFRANKKFFQKKFRFTAGILQLQHRQAVLRRKIIDEAVESLRVLARCRLPEICSHIILRSFKNFELQNLFASTDENGNRT